MTDWYPGIDTDMWQAKVAKLEAEVQFLRSSLAAVEAVWCEVHDAPNGPCPCCAAVRIADLEATVAAVEAERDRLSAGNPDFLDYLKATVERDALKAENSRLREALWKYGRHANPACWEPASIGTNYTPGSCHCGLDAALAHQPKEDADGA